MKLSNLILESRESDFIAKYGSKFGNEKAQSIIDIAKEVPNGTKFLDFLGRTLPPTIAQGLLDDKVKNTLKKFVSIGPNLQIKDINQYESFAQLYQAIEDYENRIRREVKSVEGADIVYEDNQFTVVAPLTTQASCYYGAGTKWCTASSANNTQFNNYMGDGKLFYFIDKTKPTSDRFYKVALLKKFDGDQTYYDAPDDSFKHGWILGSKKLETILGQIQQYIESKYAREVEIWKDKEKVKIEKQRIERQRIENIRRERMIAIQERRAEDEWDPEVLDKGDEGSKAWALFDFLVREGTIEPKTPESKERLEQITERLEQLNEYMQNTENANENTDLTDEIEALEEEQNELLQQKDVYDMVPVGNHYDLTSFTTTDFDEQWNVGDESEVQVSAVSYMQSLIDDVGLESFNKNFVENHIDDDEWESYLKEFFYNDVYDSPESYLDDEDRELSRSQVAEIQEKNQEIQNLKDELNNLDDEDDEYEDEVNRIENEIEDLETEIEEIKENPEGDFDEDKLEDILDNKVREYKNDPEDWYNTFYGGDSYTKFLIDNNLIDVDELIDDAISEDGYGHTLNSYDGSEEEINFQGNTYYIFYDGNYSL